ncbi:cation:proton antiporter [Prosthecomicrobium sp. N25]|uniref:cation:proton antiporter n=1 Tax=Prosthecomicrobium sp. N25 TaxID=3129254 RepID=UPI003077EEE2
MEELAINFKKYVIVPQGALVVLIPFVLWHLFRVGKVLPLAVIQILAGVLLGPSLFGALAPDTYKIIFGKELLGGVAGMALVAVTLFGFIAGTDADKEQIAHAGKSVAAISIGGMVVTAAFGALAGYFIAGAYPCLSPEQTSCATGKNPSLLLFAAAYALAVAIPALPILVILTRELGLMRHRVGQVGLASAGIGDVISWASIAIILPFAKGAGVEEAVAIALGGAALNYAFLRYGASKYFEHLLAVEAPERVILSVIGITVFISGTITAVAGLHPVIGAFMAGVFLPDRIREFAAHKLDQPTQLVLMPFFFLNTGLNTSFNFADPVVWTLFLVGILVCVSGRILGTMAMAKLVGENWAFGLTVGSLLQTKGLMAIVVMTIFAKEQVVSQTTFSAAVFMALCSTALTMPLVRFIMARVGDKVLEGGKAGAPAGASPAPA